MSQPIENYKNSNEESELEENTDFLETIQESAVETKETLLKEIPTTTQRQIKIANIIKETYASNMAIFIEKIQTKLSTVINFNDKGSQRFKVTLNSWYSNTSKLMTSKWLKTNIKRLFNNTPITNEHYIKAWKIFHKLRLNLVTIEADSLSTVSEPVLTTPPEPVHSAASKEQCRYIGGYCIAKLKYQLKSKLKNQKTIDLFRQ